MTGTTRYHSIADKAEAEADPSDVISWNGR